MNRKTMIGIIGAALAGAALAEGDTSASAFVFTRPEASSFWRTAPGPVMTLPVDFPKGAKSATLAVRGTGYAADYPVVTSGEFTLTLPEASDRLTEDVYELTLTFDSGVVRTAKVALVRGVGAGSEATARCLTATNRLKWVRSAPHAVVPVPHGTRSLTVNGAAVNDGDAGFTGAQGWYALQGLDEGDAVAASLTTDEGAYDAALTVRGLNGLAVSIR